MASARHPLTRRRLRLLPRGPDLETALLALVGRHADLEHPIVHRGLRILGPGAFRQRNGALEAAAHALDATLAAGLVGAAALDAALTRYDEVTIGHLHAHLFLLHAWQVGADHQLLPLPAHVDARRP